MKTKRFGFWFNGIIIILSICAEMFLIIFANGTLVGFIVTITGVFSALLTSKKKSLNFIFGIVNSLSYAYISQKTGLWGETINALLYVPLNIIGVIVWRTIQKKFKYIKTKNLNISTLILIFSFNIILSMLIGNLLSQIESQSMAYTDAIASVFLFSATIFSILRYQEQWTCYNIANVILLVLWGYQLFNFNVEVCSVFILRILYLAVGIYGHYQWAKNPPL
ncbi:MAG: nicotinamide riboside transporter PnuC [Clostridia bacterium]|nr:nicotinamide riboside transporter PnuC [Clostridia bacterium]